jgi:hypothetical protein
MRHIDLFIKEMLECGAISTNPDEGIIYSHQRWIQPRKLTGRITKTGYVQHCFRFNDIQKNAYAHRVIWISAHGLPNPLLDIDHINRCKTDNRIQNLRLVDKRGNMANAEMMRGETHCDAVFTDSQIMEIRARWILGGVSQFELANEYGVTQPHISKIIDGRCWSHLPILPRKFKQSSRLTEVQIKEIRLMTDVPLPIIAKQYGISKAHACKIRKGDALVAHG